MPQTSQALALARGQAKRLTQAFQRVQPQLSDWQARTASAREAATDDMPGSALSGIEEGVQQARKAILAGAPDEAVKAARWAVRGGKAMIGAPGKIFDAAQIITAKDKGRALAGTAGGWIGGAGGAALGEVAGPPGAIAGAAAGNYAGTRAGEYLYDHYPEMRDRLGEAMTSGWGDGADPMVKRMLLGPRW
jgi:hypothetical protein